jgi:hypothetical protein
VKRADRAWVWVLLAAAGVAAPTAVRSQSSGTPYAAGAKTTSKTPARAVRAHSARAALPDEARNQLAQLLEGYFAIESDEEIARAAARYRSKNGGEIFTLIATVPDPDESDFDVYFDQEIDSIRGAARGANFAPDRFSLPWKEAAPGRSLDLDLAAEPSVDTGAAPQLLADRYRLKPHEDDVAGRLPGLMLFRRPQPPTPARPTPAFHPVDLLVVLVVGETRTQGVHRQSLSSALALSDQLRSPSQDSHHLLAPFFSSSMLSLRLALDAHRGDGPIPSCARRTTAISGSANGNLGAGDLSSGANDVTFQTTNHSTQELGDAMLSALHGSGDRSQVGRVAVLTEGTPWGTGTVRDPVSGKARNFQSHQITSFEFPLHVAQLRSEREKLKQEAATTKTANLRTKLELHLDHEHPSVDDVWVQSPLTPYGVELMLQQQLVAIAGEQFRYLGILATDPADLIFLAGEARKYCPKVQLFTLGSNLLFTHPDVMRDLNGMLVASTYPLAGTRSSSADASATVRMTFASQEAEGIFNAFSALLMGMGVKPPARSVFLRDYVSSDPAQIRPPPIWISMVSNGALWPFQIIPIPMSNSDADRVKARANIMYPSPDPQATTASKAAWKDADMGALEFFFVLLTLGVGGLIAHLVATRRRIALAHGCAGQPDGLQAAWCRYLLGIWFPVSFVCAFLLVVFLHLNQDQHGKTALWTIGAGILSVLAIALTAVRFGKLLTAIKRLGNDRHAFCDAGLAGIGACVLVLAGGGWAFGYLWSLSRSTGDKTALAIDSAHLAIDRIIRPLSGVSPALPLLFLGAGFCAWGYFGLRRVWEQRQFPDATPFPPSEGLASTGLGALAESVRANQTARLLTREHGVGVGVTAFLAAYFAIKIRWTLEGLTFDGLFLLGFLVSLMLVIANAGRTVAAWLELRRLLRRLAGHPMVDAYDRVGTGATRTVAVELGARVPHPDELEAAVRMGELLARDLPPFAEPGPAELYRLRLHDEVEVARRAYTQEIEAGAADSRSGAQAALFQLARTTFGLLERLWAGESARDRSESIEHVVGDIIPSETQAEGPYRHVHTLALYRRMAAPGAQIWQRLAEDLVASQVVTLLKLGLGRIRSMMTFGVIGALLMVCAVGSYPFQPARFVSLYVWLTALSVMGAIIWVVIGIERDEVLSRIAQTRPGRIEINAAFLGKLAIYGGVPLFALVMTSFPETGAVLLSWLEPLVRALH